MNPAWEPEFLTREIVDAIHEEQIKSFGDVYEIAAAYAFHLAESQAYLDGNKRTGIQAAFVFLEGCGVSCSRLPENEAYDAMIKIATHEMGRADLAEFFRLALR